MNSRGKDDHVKPRLSPARTGRAKLEDALKKRGVTVPSP
jgi:hypothetical protein